MSDAMPQASPQDDSNAVRREAARLGLRWGAGFWTPWLVLALLALFVAPGSRAPGAFAAWQIGLWALPPLLVLMFCGRWWATRGLHVGEWTFLLAAITQGLLLLGAAVVVLFALAFQEKAASLEWSSSDVTTLAWGWGICSTWVLVLATLVGWRVRRAAARSGSAAHLAHAVSKSQHGGAKRFAYLLFSSIGIPLLLAVPFIALLHYDAQQRRAANALLQSQIADHVDTQIADLKDLNRVRSMLLTRNEMLQVMEPNAASAADALAAAFALPTGVQLVSLRTRGTGLALDVRCSVPEGEPAVLAFLARSGYRDVRVASRQREGTDPIEQMSIEAISSRGDKP